MFKAMYSFLIIMLAMLMHNQLYAADKGAKRFENKDKIVFNKYHTNNFDIFSTSIQNGKYLEENIEFIKRFTLERWGFENINYTKKCLVICVNNKKEYTELFNRDTYILKTHLIHQGTEVSAIWLWLDDNDWRTSILPKALTEIGLNEIEIKKKINVPKWMKVGIGVLNSNELDINKNLSLLDESLSEVIKFDTMNCEALLKGKFIDSKYFEADCVALCLFLTKEFPNKNILDFTVKNPLEVIVDNFGFSSYDELTYQFRKYVFNLVYDIKHARIDKTYYLNVHNNK